MYASVKLLETPSLILWTQQQIRKQFLCLCNISCQKKHVAYLLDSKDWAPPAPFQICCLCCFVVNCVVLRIVCTATGCQPNWSWQTYHITSYRIICNIVTYHIIPYYIISYIILYRIISYISYIVSYNISYHIISFHIISYHIISYNIILYHIILSYHIVSYHIV
jgi:hypothetical protein